MTSVLEMTDEELLARATKGTDEKLTILAAIDSAIHESRELPETELRRLYRLRAGIERLRTPSLTRADGLDARPPPEQIAPAPPAPGSIRRTAGATPRPSVPVDVVLGLDFGSAFSKVVVGLPHEGVPPRPVRVAPRGSTLAEGLVPSALIPCGEGFLLPEDASEPESWCQDLKLGLMRSLARDEVLDSAPAFEAASFLALLVRRAQAATKQQLGLFVNGRQVRWHLHVGVPFRLTEKARRAEFHRLARAAWLLAASGEPITRGGYRETLARADAGAASVAAVPEAIAEAIGFSRMVRRQGGMHILLDVGATTLDLCAVTSLSAAGETTWGIIEDEVHELGALMWHRERDRAASEFLRDWLKRNERRILHLDRIPDGWEPPDRAGYVEAVAESDKDFLERCLQTARKMVDKLRRRRNPGAVARGAYLNLVLCGGACSLWLYRRLVDELDGWVRAQLGLGGVRVIAPDLPGGIPADQFCRLAVAFGLAQEGLAFERILSPEQLPDILRKNTEKCYEPWDRDRYIEK